MPAFHAQTNELATAVAQAYKVFGARRLEAPLGYCSCEVCISEERERALLSTKPSALLKSDLLSLSDSVVTAPKEANAKALLPRAFELLARGDSISLSAHELSFLTPWRWQGWPEEEALAVRDFCTAYLEGMARWTPSGPGHPDADTVLVTLASIGYEWAPHVRRWATSPEPKMLARLVWVVDPLKNGKVPPNGFWSEVPEASAQLQEILMAPSTQEALEACLLADPTPEPELMGWLSALHKYLEDGASGQFWQHTLDL